MEPHGLDPRPDELVARFVLYTADGTLLRGVAMLISPRDQARSIERFCALFMYPALAALGWSVTATPMPPSLRHTEELAAVRARVQALKDEAK